MPSFIKDKNGQYYRIIIRHLFYGAASMITGAELGNNNSKIIAALKKIKVTSSQEDKELFDKFIGLIDKKFYYYFDSTSDIPSASPKLFKNKNNENDYLVHNLVDALDDDVSFNIIIEQIKNLKLIQDNFNKIKEIIKINIDYKKIQEIQEKKKSITEKTETERKKLLLKIENEYKAVKIKMPDELPITSREVGGMSGLILRLPDRKGGHSTEKFKRKYWRLASELSVDPLDDFDDSYEKLLKLKNFLKINDLTRSVDLNSLIIEHKENISSSCGYVVVLPDGFRGHENKCVESIADAKVYSSLDKIKNAYKKTKNYEVVKINLAIGESVDLVGERVKKMGEFMSVFERKAITKMLNGEHEQLLSEINRYKKILKENNIVDEGIKKEIAPSKKNKI